MSLLSRFARNASLAIALCVSLLATSSVALAADPGAGAPKKPHAAAAMAAEWAQLTPAQHAARDRANGWADLAFFGSMTGGLGLIMVADLMAVSAPVMVPVVVVGMAFISAPVVIGVVAMFSKRVHARVMAFFGDPSEEQQLQGGNVARTAPTKSAPAPAAPATAPGPNDGFHH